MAKKFTIGINCFFDNQSNSGIVNYIFNILAALKTLPDDEKPAIVLFYSLNAPLDYLRSVDYPFIDYVLFRPDPSNLLMRKGNALIRRIFKTDLYKKLSYFSKIDSLYPYFDLHDRDFAQFKNKIYWLVDFNNRAFPQHYDDKGIAQQQVQQKITSTNNKVVLSSNALFNELKMYYPDYKCDIRLLRFASSLPEISGNDVAIATQKFNVDVPYFMSPNQLWEHKNQVVVLDALNIIRNNEPALKFKVLFSGSLEVNRGKGLYIDLLRKKIEENNLEDFVSFLGVVDRSQQLALMKGSLALIQPSLYEGWSTLVEEAKALNKFIILSDLPVHQEQIDVNVAFFDPFDAGKLADEMIRQLKSPVKEIMVDYSKNVSNYGKELLHVLTT
jgi:glycosyltransferase involved in cell wall biosynthesis